MAFWRPRTMDSCNPFKRSFWTWSNLFGTSTFEWQAQQLAQRKQQILSEANDALVNFHPEDDPPTIFICPISQELLQDPVITSVGHIYDRHQLQQWLNRNPSDPLTRQPLTMHSIKSFNPFNNIITTLRSLLTRYQGIKQQKLTAAQNAIDNALIGEEPDELCDPITFNIIHQPVITPSGHIYEEKTIREHLAHAQTDPLNNKPLTATKLRACPEFKEKINQYHRKQSKLKCCLRRRATAPHHVTTEFKPILPPHTMNSPAENKQHSHIAGKPPASLFSYIGKTLVKGAALGLTLFSTYQAISHATNTTKPSFFP